MEKDSLISHVENLAPGLVSLLLLASQVPASSALVPNKNLLELIQQPFIAGLIVVAVSYLLGVFVFVISRFVVDTLSALTFRPLLLKLFNWKDFTSISPRAINERYRLVVNSALARDKDSPIRQEVVLRRQRGRLVRVLMVPFLIYVFPSYGLGTTLLALWALVVTYAYAEVSIYQESKIDQ